MARLTANPHPLDAAARDELARKAEAARIANDWWFPAKALLRDGFHADSAEFIAACSPDVILALLAAVERGEAETRDAERWRMVKPGLFIAAQDKETGVFEVVYQSARMDMVAYDLRPSLSNHPTAPVFNIEPVIDEAIRRHAAGLDPYTPRAARAHPPIQETDNA